MQLIQRIYGILRTVFGAKKPKQQPTLLITENLNGFSTETVTESLPESEHRINGFHRKPRLSSLSWGDGILVAVPKRAVKINGGAVLKIKTATHETNAGGFLTSRVVVQKGNVLILRRRGSHKTFRRLLMPS